MIPEIVYEDNHLLVVVKPPNLPVMADSSGDPDFQSLLKAFLKERDAKPGNVFLGLVHRLDRPVGGVMVFAKTSKAASRLSAQIRERTTGKEYLAVVRGEPVPAEARLQDYLLKDERTRNVRVVDASVSGARQAVLHYRVLKAQPPLSLLWVRIETGRAHQIRVQLASRGTPIVGDQRYGGNSSERDASLKPLRGQLSGMADEGVDIALWCMVMEVDHPTLGHRMRFSAMPPVCQPWERFSMDTV